MGGGGGLQNGRGGGEKSSFTPTKRGPEYILALLVGSGGGGWGGTSFEVVLTQAIEVLVMLKGRVPWYKVNPQVIRGEVLHTILTTP